ncbi:MAG: hypothetical protein JO337_13625 [Acidimicrobiales bacterium]|nr:hypothetical protein [Acidimicrobiales bacterium]
MPNPKVTAALDAMEGVEVLSPQNVEELDAHIDDGLRADVLFVMGARDPALSRADRLGARWVHIGATGIDGLAPEVLINRTVTCGRGLSAVPIAEFVMASILAFEKQLPSLWLSAPPERRGSIRLGELSTKTLGLIGLGGIGLAVARRALAFDMAVLAVRRSGAPSELPGVTVLDSLDALLPRVDHLVLAAPATAETSSLIGVPALGLIKQGVHMVNIARGSLIDQDALRGALDDDRVALASLDVTDPEPLPEGHWMYSHPRVHLTPHISWSSPDAPRRLVASFVDNLVRFLSGQPLEGVVHAEHGY